MASSRTVLVAAGVAAALALAIGIGVLVIWSGPASKPAPDDGATGDNATVATPPAKQEPPADWAAIYAKAGNAAGKLAPGFAAGSGYVMAATVSPRGELLLGTESEGLFIYQSDAGQTGAWSAVTQKDGLAENTVCALAVDKSGRIWVGHGRAGVSVGDGKQWRHFGVGEGPLGERVFSIAVGPDGSVWLATSAGLTRYDPQGRWRHYTTAQGLPALQAAKLAFAPDGTLFAAMNAAGVAIAGPSDDYAQFRVITAAPATSISPTSGEGLPSDLCNDVAVASNGHVYVATCYGIARSIDGGKSFYYFRGKGGSPKKKPAPDETTAPCLGTGSLSEDFVTTLAADAKGNVYLGYRERGGQILAPAGRDPRELPRIVRKLDCTEPTAMAATPGGYLLIAQAKEGARLLPPFAATAEGLKPAASIAPLPEAAGVPSQPELSELLRNAAAVSVAAPDGPLVVALEDDWLTQGAYLGRHGRFFAALSAMVSPADLTWGTGRDQVKYSVSSPGNALRYYVDSNHLKDVAALELPMPYLDTRVQRKLTTWDVDRREASWNDFGGGMDRSQDGPGVFVDVRVPQGLYVMSVYLHNTPKHVAEWSMRDHPLSVRPAGQSLGDYSGFAQRPELARSRGRQYRYGVYKQFLVRGPADLQVQVDRNHSQLATLSAVMLDEAEELCTGYSVTREEKAQRRTAEDQLRAVNAQRRPGIGEPASARAAADRLLSELDTVRAINPRWWGLQRRRSYEALLRFYRAQSDADATRKAATCCFYLQMYEEWEKLLTATGERSPRAIEKTLRWSGNENSYPAENYDMVRSQVTGATPAK